MHKGHMEVARAAIEKRLVDKVIMMPCRRNPLKDGSATMEDDERLRYLAAAAACYNMALGEEKITIDDMELGMPEPSYTRDTLLELRKRYPDIKFRVLTGADSYLNFKKWKDWEWIERNFSPIVYPRPGYPIEEVRTEWTLLDGVEENDVSSTAIRKMMEKEEDVTRLMPWMAPSFRLKN